MASISTGPVMFGPHGHVRVSNVLSAHPVIISRAELFAPQPARTVVAHSISGTGGWTRFSV